MLKQGADFHFEISGKIFRNKRVRDNEVRLYTAYTTALSHVTVFLPLDGYVKITVQPVFILIRPDEIGTLYAYVHVLNMDCQCI